MTTLQACASTTLREPPASVKSNIPETLLKCRKRPGVPGAGATQKDVSIFITNTVGAYENCRANLGATSKLLKKQNARIDKKG